MKPIKTLEDITEEVIRRTKPPITLNLKQIEYGPRIEKQFVPVFQEYYNLEKPTFDKCGISYSTVMGSYLAIIEDKRHSGMLDLEIIKVLENQNMKLREYSSNL
jgi:hypothetical protein